MVTEGFEIEEIKIFVHEYIDSEYQILLEQKEKGKNLIGSYT